MWQEIDGSIYREFRLKDFNEAFKFISTIVEEANRLNHHPKWEHSGREVKIWLTTHDAGNRVTDKDKELAKAIDQLYKQIETTEADDQKTTRTLEVKLYADGGSRGNPGPSASGYVIMDRQERILVEKGVYLGVTTNNQAEYQALKLGLEEAKALGANTVEVYMDSLLVVNQMLGKFKVRNRDLWPIHDAIKQIAKDFKQVSFQHVPRKLNKLADAMVNLALDKELNL